MLVLFIPIGAIHHLLFWTPGVYTALLIGLPSAGYAIWRMQVALSRRDLLTAFVGSAVAYLPLGAAMSFAGVWFDRWLPLTESMALFLGASVFVVCAAVALGAMAALHMRDDRSEALA